MKKIIPLLFVLAILAMGCPQQEPEVQQVEIGLYTPYWLFPDILSGKVKMVVERNYLAVEKDGEYVKGERLTVAARDSINWTNDLSMTFDDNGNLLQCDLIDENDELIDRTKLTLKDGQIIRGDYIRDDTLRSYMKMTYDEAGHLTGIDQFRMPGDTLMRSTLFTSDENGNFLEWQFFNPENEPTGKYIFTVNQEGRRTGYQYYNAEGDITFEQEFTYNEKGCLEKQVMRYGEGEEDVSEYSYEYDEMGNWVKVTGTSDLHGPIITERTITYFGE
ncbi:MAG TPA: hypothetical protein ENO20_04610 [Bacteroides sp.]|nr:hypothetical protein [Bacteroides sp.]